MRTLRSTPFLLFTFLAGALAVAVPGCAGLLGVGGEHLSPDGGDGGSDGGLTNDSFVPADGPVVEADAGPAGTGHTPEGSSEAGPDAAEAGALDASDASDGADGAAWDGSFASLALTPPMGWNSWGAFGSSVSEDLVKQVADTMVTTGMRDAGYQYVVIDDGWEAQSRDSNGQLVSNPATFPSGIAALAGYIHSRGLKIGVFVSAGPDSGLGLPGGFQHEAQDAKTFASWGIDYIKDVWWDASGEDPKTQYGIMHDAIVASGRPMVLSMCDGAQGSPWIWGPATGNSWRAAPGSIANDFPDILSNLDSTAEHPTAAGPGHWNDPDMLRMGVGLTSDESRSQLALWSILAAPLLVSTDLRSIPTDALAMLTNPEVIAVDADPAGRQGTLVADDGNGGQVWSKRLRNPGTRAVGLFNRGSASATITARWSDLGLGPGTVLVRDLWQRGDLGYFQDGYSTVVASHATAMLLVTGAEGTPPVPTIYPASASSNTLGGSATVDVCAACATGSGVGGLGTTSTSDGGTQSGTLTFNGVQADTAGLKTVVIEYMSGEARSATFSVNGGPPLTVQLGLSGEPGDWSPVGTHVLQMPLNAGSNTIAVGNPTSVAPDLSAIDVYP